MKQEIDIDVDLIAVFSLKKSQTCHLNLSTIEYIRNINFTESQKYFQYGEFKTRFNIITSD